MFNNLTREYAFPTMFAYFILTSIKFTARGIYKFPTYDTDNVVMVAKF